MIISTIYYEAVQFNIPINTTSIRAIIDNNNIMQPPPRLGLVLRNTEYLENIGGLNKIYTNT